MSNYYNDQWRLPNNENKDKQSNYSMDFDGSSLTGVEVGTLDFLNSSASDFTISMWVKPTSRDRGMPFTAGPTNYIYIYYFPVGSYNEFRYKIRGSATQSTIPNLTSENDISPNNWYHIALTSEGTVAKFYLNGVLLHTGVSGTSYLNSGDNVMIGKWGVTSNYEFHGQIDGVSIFNYAVSSSQVTTLYGSSSTGIGNPMSLSPAPVAYYPLGDQDAFNGADYLVPNSSLKDFVFDFIPNDYIDCGDVPLEGVYTISFWINPDATPSVLYFLFDKRDGSTTNISARVTQSSNNTIRFQIGTTNFSSTDTLTNNSWNNVVLIANGASSKIYINNGTANTGTLATPPNTTESFFIGTDNAQQSAYFFNGQMSNIQIFNTELPATGSNSVETLYNNGSPLTSMSGFTSLQGWWKLDASATYDGSDWTIEDSSSNSNDGTSSGMTQANLVQSDLSFKSGYSYALDFDGIDNSILVGNSPIVTGVFTISMWIKRTSLTSPESAASQYLIQKDNISTNRVYNCFLFTSTGKLGFFVSSTGSYDSTHRIDTLTAINDTNWHNVVFVNNGNGVVNQVYVDGAEASYSTQGTGVSALHSSTINARLCGSDYYAPANFYGSMSNVSMWNAALTSSQVSEIYNEGVPSNLNNHSAYSNLVSWWQLGSNTSWVDPYWIALDEKGTNNGQSQNVAAPNNMGENAIVDGVGSYANGLSSGMGGDEVIGDAPYSSSNSLSVNMDVEDRTTDTPN